MRFVKWEWRKVRLVQEIEHWSPDVLCLQEVDRFDDLQEELGKRGYAGIHKSRTGAATDGCAIFWKESRFLLLEEDSIEFKDLGLRDNVAQFCVLKSTTCNATFEAALSGETTGTQNKCIVVANTHILFNPKRGDIKLGQVRNLLTVAHELSKAWGGAEVVVAGDFNSTPSSPLYRFISTSEIDVSSLERREISGQLAEGEGHQPFRPNQRWRSSIQTRTVQNSTISSRSEVQVVVESVSKEQVVASGEAEACMDKELMVIKDCSSELMVISDDTPATQANEENSIEDSPGKWIRERHSEDPWEVVKKVTFFENDPDEVGSVEVSPEQLELQRVLPCGWTVEELLNATGSPECTELTHGLKLRSAYSEIEGKPGTRDAAREPLATTCHKKFMGTVDYIWHTEGLRPLKVLDLLPLHVLRQTGGLPSQKWGSDHLALVCELAFVEEN